MYDVSIYAKSKKIIDGLFCVDIKVKDLTSFLTIQPRFLDCSSLTIFGCRSRSSTEGLCAGFGFIIHWMIVCSSGDKSIKYKVLISRGR